MLKREFIDVIDNQKYAEMNKQLNKALTQGD